jgi:hypothetical protein
MSYQHRCQQCDREFETRRPDARYCSDACKYQGWVEEQVQAGAQPVTEHPLAEIRANQEASKLKSDLSTLIYQGIIDRLKVAPVHADELEPLYPIEHRQLCRELAPAQIGNLASRRYIQKIGERKSRFRSRNAAKSGIYELTRLGRERLTAGASADGQSRVSGGGGAPLRPSPALSADSGGQPTRTGASPDGSGASEKEAPESDRLFEPEPESVPMYDAFRDSEAAT